MALILPIEPINNFFLQTSDCISLSLRCSPLGSLPSVWTLLWPQGALPLWISLPSPLRQQDLHVLLPPQQHRLQVLLQRDRVPDSHADQPHHHLRRLRTQVSVMVIYVTPWEGHIGQLRSLATHPHPLSCNANNHLILYIRIILYIYLHLNPGLSRRTRPSAFISYSNLCIKLCKAPPNIK